MQSYKELHFAPHCEASPLGLSANIQKLSKRVKRSSNSSRPFECVREILVGLATMFADMGDDAAHNPLGSRVVKNESRWDTMSFSGVLASSRCSLLDGTVQVVQGGVLFAEDH